MIRIAALLESRALAVENAAAKAQGPASASSNLWMVRLLKPTRLFLLAASHLSGVPQREAHFESFGGSHGHLRWRPQPFSRAPGRPGQRHAYSNDLRRQGSSPRARHHLPATRTIIASKTSMTWGLVCVVQPVWVRVGVVLRLIIVIHSRWLWFLKSGCRWWRETVGVCDKFSVSFQLNDILFLFNIFIIE